MPRSAHLYKIDPEVVNEVVNILMQEGREYIYNKEKNLGLYIRSVTKSNEYSIIEILIDYIISVPHKERKDGR